MTFYVSIFFQERFPNVNESLNNIKEKTFTTKKDKKGNTLYEKEKKQHKLKKKTCIGRGRKNEKEEEDSTTEKSQDVSLF